MALEEAVESLKAGNPVMIYDDDDREAEVDLVYYAPTVTSDAIYTLRTLAGGLICFVTDSSITRSLGLPWGDELISMHPNLRPLASRRLGYGDRPAFTIWVNHISVKTGIRDTDRSTTIRKLDEIVGLVLEGRVEDARRIFYNEFQAPGHVPILASRSLSERRGHTELSIALSRIAGLRPSMVIAEMLDRGTALSVDKAYRIGRERGWPLVKGAEIIEACREVCGGS